MRFGIKGLRSVTIGKRIAIIPLLGLLGILVVQGINWYVGTQQERAQQLQIDGITTARQIDQALMLENRYLATLEGGIVSEVGEQFRIIEASLAKAMDEATTDEVRAIIKKVGEAAKAHMGTFDKAVTAAKGIVFSRTELARLAQEQDIMLTQSVDAITKEETDLIMTGEDLPGNKVSLRNALKEYTGLARGVLVNAYELLAFNDGEGFLTKRKTLNEAIDLSIKNAEGMVASIEDSDIKDNWSWIKDLTGQTRAQEEKLHKHWSERNKQSQALTAEVAEMGRLAESLSQAASQALQKARDWGQIVTWAAIGVILLCLLLLSWVAVRSITRPINRVVAGLSESAHEVAGASAHVSQASQTLAEGASEQAASLEETSASLEEMTAMTRSNADNAAQADGLVQETSRVMDSAASSMKKLREAMSRIDKASGETAKIIKTIDEIAFQTNLLALNAAVEAARAGEAGAGFAVVADEVRNLAMRAAEAARNTSDLIEGNIQIIRQGNDLVAGTDEEFGKAAESSRKVGELVGEIAAASREQSQGIEEVKRASDGMEKVTQQVAANAEESASSSEELSAQANSLQTLVDQLSALVGARSNGKGATQALAAGDEEEMAEEIAPAQAHRLLAQKERPRAAVRPAAPASAEEDPDFKDF